MPCEAITQEGGCFREPKPSHDVQIAGRRDRRPAQSDKAFADARQDPRRSYGDQVFQEGIRVLAFQTKRR